jgi:hypothetical protein
MTEHNKGTDLKLGEGFAFFRWHSIRWPGKGGCQNHSGYLCWMCWPKVEWR